MWEVELHSLDGFPSELEKVPQSVWQQQQQQQQQTGGRRGRPAASSSSSSTDLRCLVCDLPASGNNFGVATCESCKTFFRRNAKRDASQVRCLHQGNCNVTKEYRRSCTACRLKKCFEVGMKKELILSEEKLRMRARPTFKKPRFRWCRVPANVDVDQLLALLPPEQQQQEQRQQQQPIKIKQEEYVSIDASDVQGLGSFASQSDDRDSRRSMSPFSETEFGSAPDGGPQSAAGSFEASQIYNKLCMCVTNYQLPYTQDCASTLSSKLVNLEEGFSTLENSIRKMIRLIPEMPFFEDMDKTLLGRIIKHKVFGGIQIISVLSYDFERDAWAVLLENGHGLEEAVLNTKEAVMGSFMGLTRRRWQDGRPLFSVRDVERIYETLTGYYRDIRSLFADQRKVAAVILMAVYLLEEDTGLELSDSERALVGRVQYQYLQYLQDLAGMQRPQRQAAEHTCRKAALMLSRIRWLDVRYSDAARVVQVSQVPPLMQELAAG